MNKHVAMFIAVVLLVGGPLIAYHLHQVRKAEMMQANYQALLAAENAQMAQLEVVKQKLEQQNR